MRRVTLIPIGSDDEKLMKMLKNFLSVLTDMDVRIGEGMEIPRYAYNQGRDQYHVETILENLAYRHSGGDFILGIGDFDLYMKGYNFVFGHSNLIIGVGVMSTMRLWPSFYGNGEDASVARKRILTTATHEIGHLLGLFHCRNQGCVMNDSRSIAEMDSKNFDFCKRCLKAIEERKFKSM
jgi:archaemetzincin